MDESYRRRYDFSFFIIVVQMKYRIIEYKNGVFCIQSKSHFFDSWRPINYSGNLETARACLESCKVGDKRDIENIKANVDARKIVNIYPG